MLWLRDPSAPVPYNGRVYTINNNAVVAFSPDGIDPVIPFDEDLGDHSGELASSVEKSTVVTGLNTKISLDPTSWPLLIQQERYFEVNYRTNVRTLYTRLMEVAGSASGLPGSLSSGSTTITTELNSTFGGNSLKTWISKRSPTILFHNTNNIYQLRGNLVGVAYATGNGIQVADNNTTIQGSSINESWLLVWDDTDEHRWLPMVISLQNRPSQVAVTPNGITILYSGSADYLGITPLYGMSAPLSSEASTWFDGIPLQTINRIRLLNSAARYFPKDCSESRSINASSGDAYITYDYQYIHFSDDWGTSGSRMAYLPPTQIPQMCVYRGSRNIGVVIRKTRSVLTQKTHYWPNWY